MTKKHITTVLKIAVSLGALYFVFSKIDFKQFLNIVKDVKIGWVALAVLFFILSKIITAFRLQDLLQQIEIGITTRYNFKLYLLGMYYNLFLPGGIGGDGYKIYILGKEFDVPRKKIFYAVLLDRLGGLGIITILILAIIGSGAVLGHLSIYAWVLIPFGLLFFYFFIKLLFPTFLSAFAKINLYSLGAQLSQVVAVYFILLSMSVSANPVEYIFLFLLSSIAVAIPISIGGAGTRELTFLFGADVLGLQTDISIALSLIFYIISAAVSFGGIYYSFYPPPLEKKKAV